MKRAFLAVFACLSACGDSPSESADPDAAIVAPDGANPQVCVGLSAQPTDSQWTVRSGERDRVAEVHVPQSYDPTNPTPVVLNFHGFSSNGNQQATLSRMVAKSDAEGFIAVHATGVGLVNGWNGGTCCGDAMEENVDDVQFVADLVDELSRRLCVDPDRVYATGLSNGGFLSHRLACESDRIAAIAPVAGVLGVPNCAPSRPTAVMHFHGTSDLVVPYDGSQMLGFASVAETIAHWQTHNGCSGEETTFDEGDSLCVSATGCSAGGAVTLCTIDAGGHTWPGGVPIPGAGKTTTDLSATDAMWDFFVAHPLSR